MCITVIIDGIDYDRVKDLKTVIQDLIIAEVYSMIGDDDCLCVIDIEKTAKENGYIIKCDAPQIEYTLIKASN